MVVVDLTAGLRLQGKKGSGRVCKCQMLSLGLYKTNAIASGNWLNVKVLTSISLIIRRGLVEDQHGIIAHTRYQNIRYHF